MIKRTLPLLLLSLAASPASAQLLGGALGNAGQTVGGMGQGIGAPIGGMPQNVGALPGQTVGNVLGTSGRQLPANLVQAATAPGQFLSSAVASTGKLTTNADLLLDLRRLRHLEIIKAHSSELERGDDGVPIRRGRLLLVDPTAAQLAAATRAGYPILAQARDATLGMTMVTVGVPSRMAARKALKKLRDTVPGITADVDPLFEPAGGALAPATGVALAGAASLGGGRRIAMVDGGVASHPAMSRASIEQKGFAGRAAATGHGTAVASLLVGQQGAFKGASLGTSLFVADIYGGNPAAGSASAIVQALGWAAAKRPQVVTMSLVGPPNAALERAVGALQRLGIKVVAAVGNDGPAAPAAYPASYAGVLSVTGVDGAGRALPEAGRPSHLDVAAPGAAMVAALPGEGFADVRGTSFAAPLAAARLLAAGSTARLTAEATPGRGRVGAGIVCSSCRVTLKDMGAK